MTPTLPAGRYTGSSGAPRRRRGVPGVLTILGALAGIGVGFLAYQNFGSNEISGELLAFDLVDDSTVSIRLDVTRDDPAQPAVCIVRARSLDGTETGRREVYVPPSGDAVSTVVTEVRTSQPPVAGDVFGCSLTVPAYLEP